MLFFFLSSHPEIRTDLIPPPPPPILFFVFRVFSNPKKLSCGTWSSPRSPGWAEGEAEGADRRLPAASSLSAERSPRPGEEPRRGELLGKRRKSRVAGPGYEKCSDRQAGRHTRTRRRRASSVHLIVLLGTGTDFTHRPPPGPERPGPRKAREGGRAEGRPAPRPAPRRVGRRCPTASLPATTPGGRRTAAAGDPQFPPRPPAAAGRGLPAGRAGPGRGLPSYMGAIGARTPVIHGNAATNDARSQPPKLNTHLPS